MRELAFEYRIAFVPAMLPSQSYFRRYSPSVRDSSILFLNLLLLALRNNKKGISSYNGM
ncbi:hypothetical protein HanRHA438_Chr01g0044991 [Helianthus annuus]|nr:hypothetical protein HanRHA438_Chr01g0044991 [Helianthus annuus]